MKIYLYPPTPVSVSVPPIAYTIDGVPTDVNIDTVTPADSTPLPVQQYDSNGNIVDPGLVFILKDGTSTPVSDNADPAQVVSIPVKIMSAGGTNINITAGDINIQTTDLGANYDSMRIGDGSGNYIGVEADGSINVNNPVAEASLDVLVTEVGEINTKTPALVGGAVPVVMASSPLPTGAATEATLLDVRTNTSDTASVLSDVVTELTSLNAIDYATEATLSAINGKLPATLGQKDAADSLAVALSVEDSQFLSIIASRQVFSSISQTLVSADLIAPGNTRGFMIQNSTRAGGALRFTDTSGASATVGWLLEPGQSTSYIASGSDQLSVFDVDGLGIDCTIIWYV